MIKNLICRILGIRKYYLGQVEIIIWTESGMKIFMAEDCGIYSFQTKCPAIEIKGIVEVVE